MANHKTFDIPEISQFIEKHLGLHWREQAVDPFPYPFEQDAIEYLKTIPSKKVKKIVFDPPYSQRQLYEMYDKAGLAYNHPKNSGYWSLCRKQIARVCDDGAIVISFGWTALGIGKTLGFQELDGLIVAHGSQHNATICIAEQKVQYTL